MFDLETHLRRQRAWSLKTFGPGERTRTVCAHIRKELYELAARPDDISEYADVLLLAFDGALRSGFDPYYVAFNFVVRLNAEVTRPLLLKTVSRLETTAEINPNVWLDLVSSVASFALQRGFRWPDITAALASKQTTNEARNWPDWRTAAPGVPIEHIRNDEAA
jgi:hypothetical protein